jgi:hypothetical protein
VSRNATPIEAAAIAFVRAARKHDSAYDEGTLPPDLHAFARQRREALARLITCVDGFTTEDGERVES